MKVMIVGASGHGRVLAEALSGMTGVAMAGFLDDQVPPGSDIGGKTVLGGLALLPELFNTAQVEGIALGVGCNFVREKLHATIIASVPGMVFPPVIHRHAIIAADASVGSGAVVLAGAIIGSGASVEMGALLNTGSSLDHDSRLGAFASLAPGARTGGGVKIGQRSAIGMGALIKHGVVVGEDVVLGMGAVALRDIPACSVAYGVPAGVVRLRNSEECYL